MYTNLSDEFHNEPSQEMAIRTSQDYSMTVPIEEHHPCRESTRETTPRKKKHHSHSKTYKKLAKKAKKITFEPVNKDYRWKELRQIESKRREILLRVEDPIWVTLMRYNGTVLQNIATDGLFWSTLIAYVGFRVLAHYGDLPPELDEFPVDSITVLGGFVSFFMVFWVNQSHSRYFQLYDESMGCKGRILDTATLAVTSLPYAQASRLVRYMNAAHAAGYVGLSKVYPVGNYFNHVNQTMGLLTQQERSRLDDIDLAKGGDANREIIVWCMNEIAAAQKRGLIDHHLTAQFRDQVLGLRSQIGKLYNAKDLPIPFFYVHFITLLTSLYLPLFAITASIQAGIGPEANWISGLVRGLIVVLQAIFVIGLRILGQKMSDPYGDDLIDLSVMHYVHFTWQKSNQILQAHFPEEANPCVEDALKFHREPLGNAWEPPKPNKTPSSSCDSTFDDISCASHNLGSVVNDVDLEAGLASVPNHHHKRLVANPSFGASTTTQPTPPTPQQGGSIVASAAHSRVIFNPAMRESDFSMVTAPSIQSVQ